jgi:hypothetical protein
MRTRRRELKIILQGPETMDAEDAFDRALALRRELADLGVAVTQPRSADPDSANARCQTKGEALEWAALIVSFSGGLPGLIPLLNSWLRRNRKLRVVLEADGERMEFADLSSEDARAIANEFARRHSLGSS